MQTVRVITETLLQRAVATATTVVAAAVLSVVALGGIYPRSAQADAVTYSTSKKTYKVGVLLLDSAIDPAAPARGSENPDPYVFYIADQRTDVKPQGWELENPLAPATVTTDVYDRWRNRDGAHPYVVGQKVTKDMAAYWEVDLTKSSESDLEQYDLLFITNHRAWALNPVDREKLRKVVDAGGIVWIEDCGNMRISPGGRFFLNELQFHGGGATGVSNSAGPVIYQPAHPLLNTPYPLSFTEISNLGDKNYGDFYLVSEQPNGTQPTDIVLTAPNRDVLTTIIGNKAATDINTNLALPYIAAGNYGAGAVIATAGDMGCDINDYSGGTNAGSGGNSGAYSGKDLKAAHTADLKFLYNMIAWGSANNTYRNNNRRTASSFSSVSAPLNNAFDFTVAGTPAAARVISNASPLISQGMLFVSGRDAGGNATLRAYDIQPNRDFDGDGNNDDGMVDLIQGLPYDEIWRWTGPSIPNGTYPSSPVLATITVGGQSGDVILLTLPDGTVDSFNVRPLDAATRRLLPTNNPANTNAPATAAPYTTAMNGVAPAPVFFGNKIYVVEPNLALVRCINADGFGTLWTSSQATTMNYTATGAPTLGLNRLVVNATRDPNRGVTENTIAGNTNESTNDIMLYVPVQDTTTNKVLPFWLGARNEGTKDLISDGTNALMRLRPAAANNDQYFIAKGGNGFITPNVTLYADVKVTEGGVDRVYTREENFAAGRAVYPVVNAFFTTRGYAETWGVTWQDSGINSNYFSGRLAITKGSNPAVPGVDRLLAVADYDLVYVPASGTPPDYLKAQPGHRNTGPLTIPNATGLDTVAFAPNDLLVYGANQTPQNGGIAIGSLFGMQEREYSLSASRLRWRFLMHSDTARHDVNGVNVTDLPAFRNRMVFDPANPFGKAALIGAPNFYEALTRVTMVGSPVVTNEGVTYALARAQSAANGVVTIVMALKTTPQIVLNLGQPILEGSTVTVAQWDPLNQSVISTNGDSNDRTRVDVDFSSGRITLADFGALNNGENLFSTSSSFVVTFQPIASNATALQGTATQTQVIVRPFGTLTPVTTAADSGSVLNPAVTEQGGFSPLMWYYVLPGTPTSAPSRVGDNIFFTIGNRVIAVDADPTSNDATVRVGSGEQVYSVVDSIVYDTTTKVVERNHVRWIGARNGGARPGAGAGFGAPVGGEGILAVNTTNNGTFAYNEAITLIADNTRVMEVNADGAAVWATDGTVDQKTAGGAGPIYDPTAPGGIATPNTTRGRETFDIKAFRSPQTVRRLSASDYLVADTGNNRVVRFDRGGILRWSVERLNDPFNVLAAGESTTLNSPTDVLVRTLTSYDLTSGAVAGFEVHYLIVDSGNNRVIDVVDYYDGNGQARSPVGANGQSTGIVVWTTRTTGAEGRRLDYHNIQLIAGKDGTLFGKPLLVASVGNTAVAAANNLQLTDTAGGSVVQLDYNPKNTPFALVNGAGAFQTTKYYWGGPANVAEPATNGRVTLAIGELRFIDDTGKITFRRIHGPTYFEQLPLNLNRAGDAESVYLIVDAEGVYACTVAPAAVVGGKAVFDVLWQFDQTDYNVMNTSNATGDPRLAPGAMAPASFARSLPKFTPSSVKRLPNGHYLITNSAVGACGLFESGQFLGEVFEIIPTAFLLNGASVSQTVRGGTYANFSAPRLVKGTTLYKQQMGRDANGATVTEQPRSADRL